MPHVAIVGIGRLGGALALALSRSGYEVNELVHRGPENALRIARQLPNSKLSSISDDLPIDSDIVLITTPDPEIANAAQSIVRRLTNDAVVMHASGSLSSDILANLPQQKASLHPLVSISDSVLGADKFADAYFCVEGETLAVEEAKKIITTLGGKPFSIDTKLKPLYHASAVMASGHFTALEDMAIEMLSKCGLSQDDAKGILLPLVRSSLENLEAQPNDKALTGTFARADIDAFERHLASFQDQIPQDIQQTYLLLAARSLDLAEKSGTSKERVDELRIRLADVRSS